MEINQLQCQRQENTKQKNIIGDNRTICYIDYQTIARSLFFGSKGKTKKKEEKFYLNV